jgi:hypothetical protein
VEFLLGRRLGVSVAVVFNRMIFSGYEGDGDVSALQNVLNGNQLGDGGAHYILSTAKNPAGKEVFFFNRTDSDVPPQNSLKEVSNAKTDFSGTAAELALHFYF